jgi:predicted ATPase
MKITFSNLGAIKKTTLDLRPLTVIIGPNNSNKTYIAYSIYGLLQNIKDKFGFFITDIKLEKKSKNYISFKIDDNFFDKYIADFEETIDDFANNLNNFFQDSSQKIFSSTSFKINLSKRDIKNAFDKALRTDFEYKFNVENEVLTIHFDNTSALKGEKFEAKKFDVLAELVISTRWKLFPDSFVLPAERNALIITYRKLVNRRYKDLKNKQVSNEIKYPQPIEDFLDFLIDIGVEYDLTGVEKFNSIALKIEKEIQKKNKTNFDANSGEIKINVKKGLDIDLHNASSSIKQLAPLILYLRYNALPDDLLIIDEPEMNLHPESQAKLLEVLGMLVNAGVKVLLTTHSPYFMSHLNNLIAGDMTDEKTREKQAKSLYLKDARAFLKPEDVSAYEMRQNKAGNQTLHDLHDKDYGIRWDTLSDVSADIQQKFFEIYEQKEESSSGEQKA